MAREVKSSFGTNGLKKSNRAGIRPNSNDGSDILARLDQFLALTLLHVCVSVWGICERKSLINILIPGFSNVKKVTKLPGYDLASYVNNLQIEIIRV